MALYFLDNTPHVVLGSVTELSGASAMSITTWVKFANVDADAVIAIRGPEFSSASPWIIWRDSVALVSGRTNTLSARLNTNAGVVRAEGASQLLDDTGSWHHIAIVFEAGETDGLRLYVDGQRDANYVSTVGHANLVVDASDITIGIGAGAHQFVGRLADFAIYNVALTDAAVAQLAAGFTALTLPAALDRLAVYQDFIHGPNRPGIGPTATSSGSFVKSEHPRLIVPHATAAHVGSAQTLVVGPHRATAANVVVAGNTSGDVVVTGAESGALTPTGEVHS